MIANREEKIIVVLGYVVMPIAVAFAKKARVICCDTNEEKIDFYKQGVDPTNKVRE